MNVRSGVLALSDFGLSTADAKEAELPLDGNQMSAEKPETNATDVKDEREVEDGAPDNGGQRPTETPRENSEVKEPTDRRSRRKKKEVLPPGAHKVTFTVTIAKAIPTGQYIL